MEARLIFVSHWHMLVERGVSNPLQMRKQRPLKAAQPELPQTPVPPFNPKGWQRAQNVHGDAVTISCWRVSTLLSAAILHEQNVFFFIHDLGAGCSHFTRIRGSRQKPGEESRGRSTIAFPPRGKGVVVGDGFEPSKA
jgi:hypothetical protein